METIINYFKDLNDTSIFLPYIFICYCAVVLIFCGAVTKLIYLGIKYYKK